MKPAHSSSTSSAAIENNTKFSESSIAAPRAQDPTNNPIDHALKPSPETVPAPRFFHIREAPNRQCSCHHCYSPISTSFSNNRTLTTAKRVQPNVVTLRDSRIIYEEDVNMDNSTSNGFDLPTRGRPPAPRSPPHHISSQSEARANAIMSVNGHAMSPSSANASTNIRQSTPAQPLNGIGGLVTNDRLIVGVDFGTTYSGYGFALPKIHGI